MKHVGNVNARDIRIRQIKLLAPATFTRNSEFHIVRHKYFRECTLYMYSTRILFKEYE